MSAKNLFPSNIAGLPTWFSIRAKNEGCASFKEIYDVVVAINEKTWEEDFQKLSQDGIFIYSSHLKVPPNVVGLRSLETLRSHKIPKNLEASIEIPLKKMVREAPIKLRKFLMNMVYVGVLAELINIDEDILDEAVDHQFKSKPNFIHVNKKYLAVGRKFVCDKDKKIKTSKRLPPPCEKNKNKILMSGNTAGALGLIQGGCQFLSWYPITPSTSLVESFELYAHKYRKDKDGKNTFAVIQAEDELSAISMVLGAGWSGARATTATSGPGLSLMSEAAGLSYFAEIPAVIWGIQRAGPSTGLPTRTMQGDLSMAYNMSHGDGQHIVLLPGTLQDCYDFGQWAFDLAEQFQTLVIVLSDLDLGMNPWVSDPLRAFPQKIQRGKVLREKDLNVRIHSEVHSRTHSEVHSRANSEVHSWTNFERYRDVDDDGIPYRTLPGTLDHRAAYFTRGSGHNEKAEYSENPRNYARLLERLQKKIRGAKTSLPPPVIKFQKKIRQGIISFGSTWLAIEEVREHQRMNFMRLRALPLTKDCESFLEQHDKVYVVEQNVDGQLFRILTQEFPHHHHKFHSLRQYDGQPLTAQTLYDQGGWSK